MSSRRFRCCESAISCIRSVLLPLYITVSLLYFPPRAVLGCILLGDTPAERSANRRAWLAAFGVFSTGVCAPSTTRYVRHAECLTRVAFPLGTSYVAPHLVFFCVALAPRQPFVPTKCRMKYDFSRIPAGAKLLASSVTGGMRSIRSTEGERARLKVVSDV